MKPHRVKRLGGLVLRYTDSFRLLERGTPTRQRYYLECLKPNNVPRVLRVSREAARELTERISLREFDGACVVSGCGVFQR